MNQTLLSRWLGTHDGVVTGPDLEMLGADPDAPGLLAQGRGVFAHPRFATALTRARVRLERSPHCVLSHATAAQMWGADGFPVPKPWVLALERPHVIVPPGRRAAGFVTHQRGDLQLFEVASVCSLPCTTPTRTLCDLGAVVPPNLVERALEWALRYDQTSEPELWEAADRLSARSRRGPAVVKAILTRRGRGAPPTDSDAETVFGQIVRRRDCPEPIRQRAAGGRAGYRIDFVFDLPGLPSPVFVEIDGLAAHTGSAALVRDLRRQNTLMRERPVLLRFTSIDVFEHPAYVRQETWRHLGLSSRPPVSGT